MNIYKNFHFLNYLFLIFVLKKYGFGQTIAFLIQKILKIQTFCVKNRGKVTKHLRLGTGFFRDNPISTCLFIQALEILFLPLKTNFNTKGVEIFEHCYLYSAYADSTTFLVKDVESVENIVHEFHV